MFIQTEDTPNPLTLKFIPGRVVMDEGTADFSDEVSAARSPLAKSLFRIEGVEAVFFGSDFVSVTKSEDAEWSLIKPSILGAIMEHYMSDGPLFVEGSESEASHASQDDPIVAEIIELLDARIRPAVAMDGGDITFDRFEDGVVYVRLKGACSGCPSSTVTLKAGIENMLRHYIPEVTEVRAVDG